MPLSTIILNRQNVVPNSSNTKYSFNFQSPVQFSNAKVALSNLQIYYSWFNVSTNNNNRIFQYVWIDGTTHTVNINEGYYSIDDLNNYLEVVMIQNNHYLYDTVTKENIFYMSLRSNINYYTFEFNALPVPAVLPPLHTKPGSWALPTTTRCPQLNILGNNNFRHLIGFNPGLYPTNQISTPLGTPFTIYAQNTPQIDPITSLILRCNLIKNKLSNPVNDVLYSFAIGSAFFADSLSERPNSLNWCDIADGQYTEITIQFFDQDYKQMIIRDNQLLITLVVETE